MIRIQTSLACNLLRISVSTFKLPIKLKSFAFELFLTVEVQNLTPVIDLQLSVTMVCKLKQKLPNRK